MGLHGDYGLRRGIVGDRVSYLKKVAIDQSVPGETNNVTVSGITGPLTEQELEISRLSETMESILKELKLISQILVIGLNVQDDLEILRADVEDDFRELN